MLRNPNLPPLNLYSMFLASNEIFALLASALGYCLGRHGLADCIGAPRPGGGVPTQAPHRPADANVLRHR